MTQPNTLRRVDFPEAGEGCELLLRLPGFKHLYASYGKDYFTFCVNALLAMDTDVMDKVLAFGVTRKGEIVNDVCIDTLDGQITLDVLQSKILDAFTLGANGMTFQEHLDKIAKAAEEAAAAEGGDGENPPKSREDSSAGLKAEPTPSA